MTRPSDYTLRRLMAEGLGPAEIAARCLVSWQSVRDRLSDLAPAQDASPAPPSPPPPPRPVDRRALAISAFLASGGEIRRCPPGHAAGVSGIEESFGTAPPPRPDGGRGKRGLNFRKQRRSP